MNKKSPAVKIKKTPQLLRGMKDILPEDQKYWDFIRQEVDDMADIYSYRRIETPVLEPIALFNRSIGEATDIVEKELYAFEDRGGDKIASQFYL